MRVAVAYKWTSDPQEASVGTEGSIDWSRAKAGLSQYDPVAIELARRLADETGGEVVGVTAGAAAAGSPIACKTALSRGVDRLVVVTDDSLGGAGTTAVAEVLAAAVRHIGDVDLVVTGDSSMDIGAKMVPTVLAGLLGWPAVADVTAVTSGGGGVHVEREAPGGVEVLEITGSAVVAATADAAVPRVPGMRDLLAAGKKPVEHLQLSDLGLPDASSQVTVRASSRPDTKVRKGQMIDAADPEAAAGELVSALRLSGAL